MLLCKHMEVKIWINKNLANYWFNLEKKKNLLNKILLNYLIFHSKQYQNVDSIPDIVTLEKISQFCRIPINSLINGEVEEKQPSVNELVERRRFKLIWCSLFLFLSILALFPPIILYDNDAVYFFELFILHTYKESSFIIILAWISQFAATIIGISSVFIYKNKKLISIEEALSLFCVLNIFSFLIIVCNSFTSITLTYVLIIVIGIYILYWLMIVFSDTLNFKIKLENPPQEIYTRGAFILNCILFNIIIMTIGFHYAKWIFSLLSLICSLYCFSNIYHHIQT